MIFRTATIDDVPAIVALLANDKLGSQREVNTTPLPQTYLQAFNLIDSDPNQELIVVEEESIIGTFQLTYIHYLTYQGGIRAQIEAVRIHESHRGKGLGQKMIVWAIARAKDRGAHVIQLTTDKQRPEAIMFYEKLGFRSTHEGMKLHF